VSSRSNVGELEALLDGSTLAELTEAKPPELARLLDKALAEDGSMPFDLKVVNGVGISDREPRDLSSTRPFTEQYLSRTDMEVIGGLALAVATGEAAEDSLRFLTYMELEMMQAVATRIERDPEQYSSEQLAGMPRVQALVNSEIDRRPT